VSLLPGLAVGDTSLVAYFDAESTGWVQGRLSLYAAADHKAVLHAATFESGSVRQCRTHAVFCWTLSNRDGWGLDTKTDYVFTVTLTGPGGTARVSDFSSPAAPRALPVPPSLPAEQVRGVLGAGSSGPLDAQPAIRGVGVNTATGAFTLQDVDASLSSSYAVNMGLQRSYNSDDESASLLGIGWSFGYDARVFPKPGSTDGSMVFRAGDGSQAVYARQADGSYRSPPGTSSTLLSVPEGGWLVQTPDGDRPLLKFDAAGKLLSVTDKRGKGVSVGYDAAGQPSTLTDAGRRVVRLAVIEGRLRYVTLPDQRTVFYTYAGDRLHTVQDPDGAVTTYDYDAGRLAEVTDPLGHVRVTNTYGAGGRVSEQTDALDHRTTFAWDPAKQESTVTDPDGVVVFDGYLHNVLQYTQIGNDTTVRRADANGNTQVLGDPQGNQRDSQHDADGTSTTTVFDGSDSPPTERTHQDPGSNVMSVTDALGHTTTYTFNEFDQPVSVEDAMHNVTSFGYDADTGLLNRITDPLQHATTLAYDQVGNKIAQTDPDRHTTTFGYDTTGRQVSVIDPRGNLPHADRAKFTTTNVYDGEDRLRRSTDPLGHVQQWDYDSAGRLHAFTDANTFQSVNEYNDADQLVTSYDPDHRKTRYDYTPGGRVQKVTDGLGGVVTSTYDAAGRLETVTSPRGNVPGANAADFTTTYTYDGNGNRTSASHPYPGGPTPAVTQYSYDTANRLVAVTDPLGHTTSAQYDAAGNLVASFNAIGALTRLRYDPDNRLRWIKDPLEHTSSRHYDQAGRLDETLSAAGSKVTYTYSPAGRLTGRTSPRGYARGADPRNFTTHYSYDAAGNQIAVTDPLGHTSRAGYDAVNNLLSQTDRNEHTTRYTYDPGGRLTIIIIGPDAAGPDQATINGYDKAGHLTTRTDPRGYSTGYSYDAAGQLTASTDELGRTRQYAYDADGDLVATLTARATSSADPATRAAGTITQQYDILGRLTNRSLGSGPSYSYGYDAADRLVSLADLTGQQHRDYDDAGRLTGVRGNGTFSYSYDIGDNLKKRTLPDGATQQLKYDWDHRPTELVTAAGTAKYRYDRDGNITGTSLPGGSRQKRGYDANNQLVTLADLAPGGRVIARYSLTRDPVGNPVRLQSTRSGVSRSEAFGYDAADRLTAMCYRAATCSAAGHASGQALTYTYDLVGNRLTKTQPAAGPDRGSRTESYHYAGNELTEITGDPAGPVSFSYDADGNQTEVHTGGPSQRDTRTTYDLANRLSTVDDGTSKTTYTQDAAGNRVAADTTPDNGDPAVHTSYRWDPSGGLPMLVDEHTSAGATHSYTYHPDGMPLTLTADGTSYLNQPDPFGNTADLTSLAGAVQHRTRMTDPFGAFARDTQRGSNTPGPRLHFQGEYNDPLSGDYHLRARDYAANYGRFTSVDPLPQNISFPAISPYVFGGDNPLTNTDPTGMGCGWVAKICNAVAAVAAASLQLVETVGSGIATAYHATAHWVSQHKAAVAQVLGPVLGFLAVMACEAVTVGAGTVGCIVLAGAVIGMGQYAVTTPRDQWSVGGFLAAGAAGAAVAAGGALARVARRLPRGGAALAGAVGAAGGVVEYAATTPRDRWSARGVLQAGALGALFDVFDSKPPRRSPGGEEGPEPTAGHDGDKTSDGGERTPDGTGARATPDPTVRGGSAPRPAQVSLYGV